MYSARAPVPASRLGATPLRRFLHVKTGTKQSMAWRRSPHAWHHGGDSGTGSARIWCQFKAWQICSATQLRSCEAAKLRLGNPTHRSAHHCIAPSSGSLQCTLCLETELKSRALLAASPKLAGLSKQLGSGRSSWQAASNVGARCEHVAASFSMQQRSSTRLAGLPKQCGSSAASCNG